MRFNHTDPARGVLRLCRRDADGSTHILDRQDGAALCGGDLAADAPQFVTHVFQESTCPRCYQRHVRTVLGLNPWPRWKGGKP
jgi:hypothetical protein